MGQKWAIFWGPKMANFKAKLGFGFGEKLLTKIDFQAVMKKLNHSKLDQKGPSVTKFDFP